MATESENFDEICPDCGALVPGGRNGCRKLFDEVLAKEFSDYKYAREHRLTVDIYSLQHPSDYMQSPKSYAAHLTGLYAAMKCDSSPAINQAMQQWLSTNPKNLERPDDPVPRKRGVLTIAYLHEAEGPDEHVRRVREWADSTWDAWRDYSEFAKQWILAASNRK